MRFPTLASFSLAPMLSRLRRRAIGAALLGLFALAALYQFTVAGNMVLEAEYGALNARLIVAGVYALAALTTFIALWATRTKRAVPQDAAGLASARNAQIAMLVEAAVAGYSLARKIPGR